MKLQRIVGLSAVLALLAGGTGQVLAANFYVGGDGASDRNPGTASQPFATIQKAAGVAAAGDVVNIRPGIYRETIVPANSGAPGQPVTFQPEGDAAVTVSGADLADGGWTVYRSQIYQKAIALPLTGYGADHRQRHALGQSGVCRRKDDDRSPVAEPGRCG